MDEFETLRQGCGVLKPTGAPRPEGQNRLRLDACSALLISVPTSGNRPGHRVLRAAVRPVRSHRRAVQSDLVSRDKCIVQKFLTAIQVIENVEN